jgi:16S rRNA (cytosine967-C5)-methyltransferase
VSSSADRLQAARFLIRVEDGAYSTRLLAGSASRGVRTRVLGVLRWQGTLDHALSRHSRRPPAELDAEVRAALRVGLFDAAVLGVPPAVATDGAIHLARRLGRSSAGGLVNAVLRRSIPDWAELISTGGAAIRHSHPEWLSDRWGDQFGEEAAGAAMAAAQTPADVWVWWLDRPSETTSLETHPWCPGAWTAAVGGAELIPAVRDGVAYAQDPSSQLVAHVARALAKPVGRMADVCGAPGGKSALWIRLGGERPVAMDRHLGRTRLMSALLHRLGGAPVVVGDAARSPLRPGSWDLVLVDAPCTGTGTLRRHPEIKWRLRPGSITEMASAQREILAQSVRLAAPGGVVLYATCSIEPEENEAHFEELPEGFERQDLAAFLPAGVPWIATSAGGVRILPSLFGDGFTMHALRRHEF